MKKTLISLTLTATLAAGTTAFAQTALRGGFVEGADVMFYMDSDAINQSAFAQTVEDLQPDEVKAESEAKVKAFTEATGLGEDDIKTLVLSMDIDGIDFQSQDPAQLENAQALLAVESAKAITLDQLKAGLTVLAGENAKNANMTVTEADGMQVLKLEPAEAQDGPDKAYATLGDDGKTVLFGFNTDSLKQGLARISGGEMASPSDDMANAIKKIGQRHVRMVVVLPEDARAKIREGVQATAAQGGMGSMIAPFGTVESLLISANTRENLDLYLSLDLGNNANATQAAGMLQSMIPMFMMNAGQQLGPKAMQISQKIKIAPEESVVTMSVNLTPDDITPPKAPAGGESGTTPEANGGM